MTRYLFLMLIFLASGDAMCQNVVKVTNINPVTGGSMPTGMIVFDNNIFFGGTDPDNKFHVYKTDGSATGVQQVSNRSFTSEARSFREFKGKLYFTAGGILWSTNGFLVDSVCKTQYPLKQFVEFGDKLLFGKGATVWYLQPSDNTVHDLDELLQSAFISIDDYTVYQNKLILSLRSGANAHQLWISDGTKAGTKLLKDIVPGGIANACGFFEYQGKLFFSAENGLAPAYQHFYDLWVSDGTESGTYKMKDLYPRSNFPLVFFGNSQRLFVYSNSYYNDRAIWSTDGVVVDSVTSPPFFNTPFMFKDKAFLSVPNPSNFDQLWVFDGTPGGFQKFVTNGLCRAPLCFTEFNDKMHYVALTPELSGYELWISDGTGSGTYRPKFPNQVNYSPLVLTREFCEFNNGLYFAANYDHKGFELWRLDHFGTDIDELEQPRVNIFPNPASDKLELTLPAKGNVTINDVAGRTLISAVADAHSTIDISNLQPGIYFFRYNDIVIKFLKQ